MGRLTWSDENSRILLNILNEEKNRGVSKFNWGNIAKIFNTHTKFDVEAKQVQNHYNDLKERHKCWEQLHSMTGISFNPTTKKVDVEERSTERFKAFLERNRKYGKQIVKQADLPNIDEMIKLFHGKSAHGVGGCFSSAMGKGSSYLSRQIDDLTSDDQFQDTEDSDDELMESQDPISVDEEKSIPSSKSRKVSMKKTRKRNIKEPFSVEEHNRREKSFDSVIQLLLGAGVGSSNKASTTQMVSEELTRMNVAEESGDEYFVAAVSYLSDEKHANIFLALQNDNQKHIYLRRMGADPSFIQLF